MVRGGWLVLLALGLLISAGPSQAKTGLAYDYAKLTGPGLTGALVVQDTRPPYLLNAELDEMATGRLHDPSVNNDALGPKYRLVYYLEDSTVEVEFYPYAQPRPVAFVPSRQSVTISSDNGSESVQIESGWYDYPPRLVDSLKEIGLPNEAPSSPLGRLPVGSVLVGVVLLLAWGAKRPRAPSHPMPA
ncbi:MAG: hypothetical protein GEU78_00625 [Actinobacteria bacterium]|nr:hypothetical protein [Actinomycetota bacterium]